MGLKRWKKYVTTCKTSHDSIIYDGTLVGS